MVAERCETVT